MNTTITVFSNDPSGLSEAEKALLQTIINRFAHDVGRLMKGVEVKTFKSEEDFERQKNPICDRVNGGEDGERPSFLMPDSSPALAASCHS